MSFTDEDFLRIAIELAQKSRKKGEDPFGAVLVCNGEIMHKAHDQSIINCDPTSHAELSVISEYCRLSNNFSLEGYTLYTSTEPCVMCAGAIKWARISKIVYSVSQCMLQKLSGGRPKPCCDNILNTGKKKIKVVGPLIPEEGVQVFQNYKFISKEERIKKH
ncbi:MAG: nucleoside deaminase [Clostridium sp.]|uniref:nucleoside deaminase n=1 Tax=Clostridium sp. TaxID=1506 RepID=UPI003D6C9E02